MMQNGKVTILVVDDDVDDREFLTEAINMVDSDIDCIVAINGQDALDMLRQEEGILPDYIFLDINMPKMNGNECLKLIKNEPALCEIPVIMYSTTNRIEDIEESKQNGAREFITKPVKLKSLVDIIKVIISSHIAFSVFPN